MLVEVDLGNHRDGVARLQVADHFTLQTGLAAHVEVRRNDGGRSGHERDGWLGNLFDRLLLVRGRRLFLGDRRNGIGAFSRRRSRRRWPWPARELAAARVVLTCATTVVASIVPKINQQFVFISQ